MVERRIGRRLQPITIRLRRLWFLSLLAALWMLLAAIGLALALYAERAHRTPPISPVLLVFISLAAIVFIYIVSWQRTRDYRQIAHRIEKYYPDLNARLLTAMEQQPVNESGTYSYLQETVIREALQHDYHHPWYRIVPGTRLLFAYTACFISFVLICTASWRLWAASIPYSGSAANSSMQIFIPGEPSRFDVEPGDAEVERGTNVLVTVRFQTAPPPEVTLVATSAASNDQLPMRRSLEDPLFGARLENIQQPLDYMIRFEEGGSKLFHINVFEYPRLERVDAQLNFPSFTSQASKQLTDVRRITAVEGTELILTCYVNKPLAEAVLLNDDDEQVTVHSATDDPLVYTATMKLTKSQRWRFKLLDEQGRSNKKPPAELVVQVTPNQPPDLKWVAPGHDTRVSPLEELITAGTVFDDFGVVRHGLTYNQAEKEPVDVVLGDARPGGERHAFQHLIALETLTAQPDELLSYHLWAEDIGPDGQVRRVFSDMYFAEVRPFEEIFRQGQAQPESMQQQQQQQAGGAGQQAEQLAEIQKQIINGTWNVIRRETRSPVSDAFVDDVGVLRESQQSAVEQLDAMSGEVQDLKSLVHLDSARKAMQSALDALAAAQNDKQADRLKAALSAEQAAYQSLLRLRAREHEVVRSRQSASSAGSAGGSNSRAQQELQQLELNNDQNRYETERRAQAEDPQQREMLQNLNRLRELARRQGDLNERIKELQSALDQAQTEAERQELENQLKRLREEQEEILRDTEELQQRLDQPANQERLAEERQRLAETRENVRRASEALEEGELSQAVTSGTRAERELKDLQEDFRRQTSNQFEEEMRQMRDDAQQLAENEQQISEQLQQLVQQESQSLRPSDERQQIEQSLQQQVGRIQQLMDAMRETVQRAEQDEPLLSRKLYDTYRQTEQEKPQEALEQATQWMQQGFPDQAQQPEQVARGGIERLAAGVQDAAEGILGDETEALKRARDELDRLAEQLAQELDRQNPNADEQASNQQSSGQAAPTQPARAQNAPVGRDAQQQPSQADSQAAAQPPEQSSAEQPSNQEASGEQQSAQQQSGQQQSGGQQSSEQQSSEQQSSEQQSPQGSAANGQTSGAQQQSPQQENQQAANQPADDNSQQNLSGAPVAESNRRPDGDRAGGGGPGGEEIWSQQMERWADQINNVIAPLTGDDYRDWSDRLRDVEEMLDDPDLRAEAARIRERAREMRVEWKRHSELPSWDLVRDEVQQPLVELRDRIAEELRRRGGEKELAPVDRDPVPAEFEEHVRRYYEELGSGRP